MSTSTVYALMFSLGHTDGERWELVLYQGEELGRSLPQSNGSAATEEKIMETLTRKALLSYEQIGISARKVGHTTFPDRSISEVRTMVQRDYGALCVSSCNPEDADCFLGFLGNTPNNVESPTKEAHYLVEELRFTLAPVYN